MSSNIGYLKSLVDGLSRKEKVDIAKAGHHELLPVYMVIDSLKKEQEMDDALKGIEAQNNMPTREESTIRQQLLAEIGATDTSRESVREETSGIGSSGLRELPGGGAGDPMPSGYSGPSWAGKMPGGSMTAARGGVVPGYANGGFYGQQGEEDYLKGLSVDELNANYYNSLEPYTGTSGFSFPSRPYFGESPSIRFPDPLGDSPFEDISPAGLWGFATRANRVRRVVENLKKVDPKTLTSAERATLQARKALEEMLEGEKTLGPAWDATRGAFNRGVTGTRDLFNRGATGTKDLYGRGATTTKDWLSGAGSTIGGARDRFTGGIRSLFNRTTSKTTPKAKFDKGHDRIFGSTGGGGNRWKPTSSGLKTAGKWGIPTLGGLGVAYALANADPEEDMEYETAVRKRGEEGLGDRLTPQEADSILAQATDSTSGAGGPSRGRAAHFTSEQLAQIPSDGNGDINLDSLLVPQGPTRTMASTAGSEAALQAINERIDAFRTELGKLSPGQKMQEDLIKEQIERLEATRNVAIQRTLNRQGENVRTADADFASLEERYNTKVNAVDSLYEKRTGQLEDRLQPRIDRGVASLKSNAADYDANEKAAIWFAMSKAFGKRNTDPLNSGLDSIGTDLQDFRDTQADSASTMRGDLNDLEDLLQSGQISYEDAHLLATEQLGDQLFSGKRDMRDSLREGTYGYEDSLLDLTTSTQDAINTLNLGSIGDKISTELAARTLDDPYLTLLQDQLNNSERMDLATQRAMDERTQAQIEASGQNIPTREDAQAQLNYAKDLRARLREGNAPDDLEEMIEAAEDFGHYWMNFHRRASAPAPPKDFRLLLPEDSTDLTPDSSIVTSSSNTFDPTKFRQHLKKG